MRLGFLRGLRVKVGSDLEICHVLFYLAQDHGVCS